jgi:cytochrome c biogenesis protein CcmG, thiol:disulfide interchange protein DsbE
MKRLLWLGPLAALLAFLVFLGAGLGRDVARVPSPFVGKPLPPFSATTLGSDGAAAAPAGPQQLQGQVWLLNVWASWCAPCREEHPLLVAYAAQPGAARVVGLNYKDKPEAAHAWLRQLGNPYLLNLVDADGRIGIDLGVYGVPETFVIDKAGIVRLKHVGALTPEVMLREIAPLVKALNDG